MKTVKQHFEERGPHCKKVNEFGPYSDHVSNFVAWCRNSKEITAWELYKKNTTPNSAIVQDIIYCTNYGTRHDDESEIKRAVANYLKEYRDVILENLWGHLRYEDLESDDLRELVFIQSVTADRKLSPDIIDDYSPIQHYDEIVEIQKEAITLAMGTPSDSDARSFLKEMMYIDHLHVLRMDGRVVHLLPKPESDQLYFFTVGQVDGLQKHLQKYTSKFEDYSELYWSISAVILNNCREVRRKIQHALAVDIDKHPQRMVSL